MLDEVGIHCNIQQVDGATNNQYMKDGTWEGLMLHFATIAPDLGLYMGRHLDKNGAYYAKGIQHPDKEMELLEEIRRCMDPMRSTSWKRSCRQQSTMPRMAPACLAACCT